MKINLTKSFADQLWFSQVQLIFDQIVFTAEDLSCHKYTQFTALYAVIAAFNLPFKLRYSLNIEKNEQNSKTYLFLVISRHNEAKWRKMSAFLTADFVDLHSLYSDWPENAGSRWQPRFPAVFELFPCATSRSSENFFIKKIHIGKKASFHFIVKTEKKIRKRRLLGR